MLPKVIIHNEISLDGSIKGFDVNMGTYYRVAIGYQPDIILVGSITAKEGITEISPEMENDFKKPGSPSDDVRPYWVIPDSRGILKGLLHVIRRFEYSKDAIILVTENTPSTYIDYLKKRNYGYIVSGKENIDYREALEALVERYGSKTVLTDSGGILNSILLERGLVSEISIIVSPVLVGRNGTNLFRGLNLPSGLRLKLTRNEVISGSFLLLVYEVLAK